MHGLIGFLHTILEVSSTNILNVVYLSIMKLVFFSWPYINCTTASSVVQPTATGKSVNCVILVTVDAMQSLSLTENQRQAIGELQYQEIQPNEV